MRRLMIISMRAETSNPDVGRQKVLNQLGLALDRTGWKVHWLGLARPRWKWAAFGLGAVRWLGAALSGKIFPLQTCLPLQGKFEIPRPQATVSDAGAAFYIDGVRLAYLCSALKRHPRARMIVDFDDLMSRRVNRMHKRGETFSPGIFRDYFPAFAEPILAKAKRLLSGLYYVEKRLLRRAEIRASREANAIAFASPYEARLFQRFLRRYAPPPASLEIIVLGPCIRAATPNRAFADPAPAELRFVFIGSDMFEQNRIAIAKIVELAQAGKLALPTYIGGRMVEEYPAVPGVTFCGYLNSVRELYSPGSILLVPQSVRGGLKTKTLEALEHAVPVIGSYEALEGFEGSYPWRLTGSELATMVGDADALRSGYAAALAAGLEICARHYTFRIFKERLLGFLDEESDEESREGISEARPAVQLAGRRN